MTLLILITAAKVIRQRESESRVPIIALTANAYEENKQKCLDAGMDAFLTKPVDNAKLQSTLSKWL